VKRAVDDIWLWGLEDELRGRGLGHLRVKKHGDSLLVQSGEPDDPYNHFKLTALPRQQWRVSMGTRGKVWEPTPFQGTLKEVVALVIDTFPWMVEPRA
jgi:hypothetical protein